MFTRVASLFVLAPLAFAGISLASGVQFPVADGGTGNTYEVVIDASLARDAAMHKAESVHGHLVTITSAAEQAFVESLFADSNVPTGSYWIGLERAGLDQFRWFTNEPFAYNNFPSGEPNNFMGDENAGQIYWTQDVAADVFNRRGAWNDAPANGYTEGDIPDLIRAGLVIERELLVGNDGNGTDGPPVAIPLPPAILAAPFTVALAGLVARRRRAA
jgi:hypothetical protein